MPQAVWLAIGWVASGLAVVGTVLPVMPTVPFLLVAAWAFSRSSPRLRQKIRDHPHYGPAVRSWQDRGAIAPVAKIWAILAMSLGVGFAVWLGLDPRLVAIQAAVCILVGAYVVSRPGA